MEEEGRAPASLLLAPAQMVRQSACHIARAAPFLGCLEQRYAEWINTGTLTSECPQVAGMAIETYSSTRSRQAR